MWFTCEQMCHAAHVKNRGNFVQQILSFNLHLGFNDHIWATLANEPYGLPHFAFFDTFL